MTIAEWCCARSAPPPGPRVFARPSYVKTGTAVYLATVA